MSKRTYIGVYILGWEHQDPEPRTMEFEVPPGADPREVMHICDLILVTTFSAEDLEYVREAICDG